MYLIRNPTSDFSVTERHCNQLSYMGPGDFILNVDVGYKGVCSVYLFSFCMFDSEMHRRRHQTLLDGHTAVLCTTA